MELAAPLIKKADDGRDADKRTGNFAPISIEVKNYRSYTEAEFDFSDVHMAMVNGAERRRKEQPLYGCHRRLPL